MKIISLETDLSLDGMSRVYRELEKKQAVKGDLIRKNKNDIGVIINKNDCAIYMGSFNKKEDVLVTEFNLGTFAQFYSVKGSESYSRYKDTLEKACKEAQNDCDNTY